MYDSRSLGLNILYMIKHLSCIKMDYENMRVAELKGLARERGLRDYSRLRKDELINFIRGSKRRPQPRQPPPGGAQAPTQPNQSIRFRPDRPRQPEIMRRLARPAPRPTPQKRNVEFKPYQLKCKREEERSFSRAERIRPPTERKRSRRLNE